MRRFVPVVAVVFASLLFATPAFAGSAHFVGDPAATRAGDSLTVTGKVAGLGDEPQVHIVLTATAECVNPGGNHPQAGNKESLNAEGDFPVQNGKALFSLTVTAVFQPACSPPMSVVFSDVTVTDQTSGITSTLPGTF
jgi:hypothetical protein